MKCKNIFYRKFLININLIMHLCTLMIYSCYGVFNAEDMRNGDSVIFDGIEQERSYERVYDGNK